MAFKVKSSNIKFGNNLASQKILVLETEPLIFLAVSIVFVAERR
jgi:hypothetical protein